MRLRRFFCCFALALFAALALIGCGADGNDSTGDSSASATGQDIRFVLAYDAAGGINPYVSGAALTWQNAALLFCRPVTITPDFTLEYQLAASVETMGTGAVISLESGWHFADGAPVTAQDVAASLLAAKASTSYGPRFANVTDVQTDGDNVLVTLAAPDAMFAYLADFPVMKAQEVNALFPTASGRYALTVKENGDTVLTRSPYTDAAGAPLEEIGLSPARREDQLVGSLNIGDITFYAFETLDGNLSSVASRTALFKLNNLVYLGFQSAPGHPTANAGVRRAVAAAVDRSALAEKAWYSRAYAAVSAVNPAYAAAADAAVYAPLADDAAAGAALDEAGYVVAGDRRESAADGPLVLRLLCPADHSEMLYAANLITARLNALGVAVTLVPAQGDAYRAALEAGDFDMYIGEVKLYNNMDMSPFFTPAGAARYGISPSSALLSAYDAFRADAGALAGFEQALADEAPFTPLVYRCGVAAYSRFLGGLTPSLSDVFYGLSNLTKE